MEALKCGDAPTLVTNLEVMELLQERLTTRQTPDMFSSDGKKKGPSFQSRDWIEQTVFEYLKSSPAGSSDVKLDELPKLVETLRREAATASPSSDADDAKSDEDDGAIQGYGLTTAETLQVLNHLPTSLVELHLLIEDLEKRIPEEEKQMDFLRMLSQYSGKEVVEAAAGDDDEEVANDMED
ncbi:hypothetical protein ACHAXM_004411 [Skeletonema potamos]|jgi:hypothetical protein